ncbi:ribonucleoside-diphosphate reductase subunit alpha [Methylobacterium ajmalii]|uniref:ribonucleoside-diphosphate reductase subunit alpha n=1 Tax=Methylobacterium ajmalii TaxID=2738439 RepID=UPI002F35807F
MTMEYPKGYWLNAQSRQYLAGGYVAKGVEAETHYREIADAAEAMLFSMAIDPESLEKAKGYGDKLYDYLMRGWISLASPVISNFGRDTGLPISCNGSYFEDRTSSILLKTAEIGMMTKLGAGTSTYIGKLRHRNAGIRGGGKSNGPTHFCELIQAETDVISQAQVRRGHNAVYLDVRHPDIMEFLEMREIGNPVQNISLGVCIDDAWMTEVEDAVARFRVDQTCLTDEERQKVEVLLRIVRKRDESGYPFLFFSDTVNRTSPQVYRDKQILIWASNMCNEIYLASSNEWSFVCCLSSLNLLHYHAWKDTDLVEVMTIFLDCVIEEYLRKIRAMHPDEQFLMRCAVKFAEEQRALGLGVLGWHSLLQSQMIAFDSREARRLNVEIHRMIDRKSLAASQWMARKFGEPALLKGYGLRNVTRMAIAPTTSSSFILGQVSQGIEPYDSNYFTHDLQKGKFGFRNPFLAELLAEKGRDTPETWQSILMRGGSVQHLDFLTAHEKDVFKTFGEIDQRAIVLQAAERQRFIDQGQSLNVKIHPKTPVNDNIDLIFDGWRRGLKGFYYQRSTNPIQEYVRDLASCEACEA